MSTRLPGSPAHVGLPGATLHTADVAACVVIAAILVLGCDFALSAMLAATGSVEPINRHIAWSAAYSLLLIGSIWLVFATRRGISFAALGYLAVDRRMRLIAVGWGRAGDGGVVGRIRPRGGNRRMGCDRLLVGN